jgi:hypothetical protein
MYPNGENNTPISELELIGSRTTGPPKHLPLSLVYFQMDRTKGPHKKDLHLSLVYLQIERTKDHKTRFALQLIISSNVKNHRRTTQK